MLRVQADTAHVYRRARVHDSFNHGPTTHANPAVTASIADPGSVPRTCRGAVNTVFATPV